MRRRQKQSSKPIVIDVYSGAGGLSLGAARAGFEVRTAVDLDERALATHHANFPNSLHIEQDVATLRGEALLDYSELKKGELSGLIGGPPCQGFSIIGNRQGSDPRNHLFTEFIRLVDETRPGFFLVENVPNIQAPNYRRLLRAALAIVPRRYEVLDPFEVAACDYGAPTTRRRVVFFGYDPARVGELKASHFAAAKVDDVVNVRTALRGMPLDISESAIEDVRSWRRVYVERREGFFNKISGDRPMGIGDREAIKRYSEHSEVQGNFGTRHSRKLVSRYASLEPGERDPITKSVRLDPDGLCPTLRAGTGPDRGRFQAVRPIHYLRPRVITPREAARLQGFPDWFVFDRTKWHSFRQIGNSVSPLVAESLLRVVASAVRR